MTIRDVSSADWILRVFPGPEGAPRGQALWRGRAYPCVLGQRVVPAPLKREEDGATPAGLFPLRQLYYRPDRLTRPRTGLPISEITATLGWCDDPKSRQYNRPVELPVDASAESLWREDRKYDLVVTIGHNDAPVRPDYGSAIFLHIASPEFTATRGCVAFVREDLVELVADLNPASLVRIYAAPDGR